MLRISRLHAVEVLDSRARPTLPVILETTAGLRVAPECPPEPPPAPGKPSNCATPTGTATGASPGPSPMSTARSPTR